jgi:uncharacterized protein (TIGR02271 family)
MNTIQAGWNAYDMADEKIGEVAEVGQNYVLVQKGLFFPKDIYIPLSYVSNIDENDQSVIINASKSEVESMNWDAPPTDGGGDWNMSTDASSTGGMVDASQSTNLGTAGTASTASMDTSMDTGRTTDDSFTVPLREERLQAERREREAGEVAVGTHVVEQQESIEVPVTHEEVEVTRRRVDRPDTGGEIIDDGETIRVPIRAEEVDVRKDSRVVEEVEISKRPVTETQRVSETVRREEIDVDTTGDVLTGAGASRTQRSDLDEGSISTGSRRDDELTDDPYRKS